MSLKQELHCVAQEQKKNLVYRGPIVRVACRQGADIVIQFDQLGSRLTTNDGRPPRGFEVAGADGVYHPAQAQISGAAAVVVKPPMALPRRVRYGWVEFPEPPLNLVNEAGLPTGPFATEVQERP